MRVLVTGAGGFCGRHLLRHLEQQRVEVHTVGPRPTSSNHHTANPQDVTSLAYAVTASRPSYIFHLAGISGTSTISSYYAVNTQYAAALFEALDLARCHCPVLLVGSAAEYGSVTPEQLPITEDLPPRPYSHYGISKLAQTQLGMVVAAAGRPVVVVRPFNVIGIGMPEHGAVQMFARQIADIVKGRREPIVEVGNLDATRDFVTVEAVVEVYWRLITTPAAYGQIVNVCSGVATSLRDVLEMLVAAAGMPIAVKRDPARLKTVDVDRHCGSPSKLCAILGESAPVHLEAALRRIVDELVQHP